MTVLRNSRFTRLLLLLVCSPLSSCSRAPSVDLLGSFFPAWLLCFVAGTVLAALVRLLLLRLNMKVLFPILAYPSLAAFFTFTLWLVFFY
jgi:fructose-specific phosphotransferase system IIC component